MTKTNENKTENALYSWATGRFAGIALGLAVVYFIHTTGMIKKTFSFFKPDKGKGTQPQQPDAGTSTKIG
ncbi:MAG: hypothetical protein mread185_000051 [Mycoplasmataceae bacterium]|nr:MAG: hypothetical protein mread185_000051 [Mycoplasmataceae bacterium]